MKLTEQAYTKLIEQDLAFINNQLPDGLETDHIKVVLCNSIDMHYSNTISQMQPEWVSVEDRLPAESGQVLGCMKDTLDIYVCFYKPSRKLFLVYGAGADPISDMNVTHWMPLPQPPTK